MDGEMRPAQGLATARQTAEGRPGWDGRSGPGQE